MGTSGAAQDTKCKAEWEKGHKVFPSWVLKSELRQTRVLQPRALICVDEDCSWCSCCLPGH